VSVSIDRAAPPWLVRVEDDDAVAGVPTPIVWNLRGMLKWWREYPLSMDFLASAADNHALKALETRLYREALGDALPARVSATQPPLRILDAACGIGRFAVPLAADGHAVDGIDACLPSLEAAARHGAEGPGLRLVWGDVTSLDGSFPDDAYDLALAFELLCYLPDPTRTVELLARRLKPGGRLIASVEAWPGALLADASGVQLNNLAEVLRSKTISEPNERWVQACDRDDLGAILTAAGLEPLSIVGTHYLPDGPMAALLDHERIGDLDYDDAICECERLLRENAELGGLPRAWLIVAERPR
jgi:2-polyprenyl-3-methyl-5-hydroxy-6-metoxy-1,4-benzoquinol methylase